MCKISEQKNIYLITTKRTKHSKKKKIDVSGYLKMKFSILQKIPEVK